MDLHLKDQDFDAFEGFSEAELELDAFGPGLHAFSDGDPEALPPKLATRLPASFLNQLIAELMSVLARSGQAGSREDLEQLWKAIAPAGVGLFGDGSDQDPNIEELVIADEQTMQSDWLGRRVRIAAGGHLRTNGWRLYLSDLLTVEEGGLISNDGQPGADAIDNGTGGLGGAGGFQHTLDGAGNGGQGGDVDGLPGTPSNFAPVGSGGQGGANGNNQGGAGGTGTPPPLAAGSPRTLRAATTGRVEGFGTAGWLRGGAGGGGGAGLNILGGGGGGGGGGVVLIAVHRLDCRGEIRAAGGAGGAGFGVSGGGGGGQGGRVLVTCRYRLDDGQTGAIHAPGGLGGEAEDGQPGTAGDAGEVLLLRA